MGEARGGDAERPFGVRTWAGGEPSFSSKLWNVAESKLGWSFDVSGEQAVLMWRSPEWMGLGGLTASAPLSLSQSGADSGGLIETDTENTAISPSSSTRGGGGVGESDVSSWDYTNRLYKNSSGVQNHRIHFFHLFRKKKWKHHLRTGC